MAIQNSIHDYIRRFVTVYLPIVRKASSQTIRAYTIGLNSFRKYLKEQYKIEFSKLSFEDFTAQKVSAWLNFLQEQEGNKEATLNLRLTAIRNFIRYCSDRSSEFSAIYNELKQIRKFKPQSSAATAEIGVKFLTEPQLKLLFSLPDVCKPKGRRDRLFMILAYETGARLSELLNLRLKDISDDSGQVRILILNGKGDKSRFAPVPKAVLPHLIASLQEFHPDSIQDDFLFYVYHDGQKLRMDNSTAEAFVKAYGKQAHASDSSFPESLHPHMFRHSLGTALYRRGIPLSYIADLLGHSSLDTTKIYSKSDIKILHQKVSEVNEDINRKLGKSKPGKLWKGNEEELLKLCGLK